MGKIVEFQNVTFQYEEDPYRMFEDLSFSVSQGEFVAVVGASGCGKSTLFRLIHQLEETERGNILVGGKDVRGQKGYSGFMPQRDLLMPWRTLERNLALPLELKKVPKAEQKAQVREMLDRVGLGGSGGKYPGELSGGMRQRASFARTLLSGSDLLLLDEPFSALDYLTRVSLQEWLAEQWESLGKTVLFVTHDVEEALFLATRILVLQGRPVRELASISVPLPFPRNRKMLEAPEIQDLKEQLIEGLKEETQDLEGREKAERKEEAQNEEQ